MNRSSLVIKRTLNLDIRKKWPNTSFHNMIINFICFKKIFLRYYLTDTIKKIFKSFLIMKNLYEKLKFIKLVVLDFDGVFTDGGIYLDYKSQGFRRFDVKDGFRDKVTPKK